MHSDDSADVKSTIDDLLHRSLIHKRSADFVKFFDFIARFQHYSRYNTLLVFTQNPNITFFGSAAYWRRTFYREIKVEARPHIILVPKGPIMLVYDIFDTTGDLTAEQFLEQGLGRNPNAVVGLLDDPTFEYAQFEARRWGIAVLYRPLTYFTGGQFKKRSSSELEIYLKEGMSPAENFSVLIHELAHLFLGHVGSVQLKHSTGAKPLVIEGRTISTEKQELEAETISFLLCKKIDLQTSSAEYLAKFIKSEDDLLSFRYELVIKTADRIEKLFLRPPHSTSQPINLRFG